MLVEVVDVDNLLFLLGSLRDLQLQQRFEYFYLLEMDFLHFFHGSEKFTQKLNSFKITEISFLAIVWI